MACSDLIKTKNTILGNIEKTILPNYLSSRSSTIGYLKAFLKDYGDYNCGADLKFAANNFLKQLTSDDHTSSDFILQDFASNTLLDKCKGFSTKCTIGGCRISLGSVNAGLIDFFKNRHELFINKKSLSKAVDDINLDSSCVKESKSSEAAASGTAKTILYISLGLILIVVSIIIYRKYKK